MDKTVYISYVDKIDPERVKLIMNICTNIVAQKKPTALYFLFSSPGGDVESGIALHNYLKALPVKIIMHNIGTIDSIANVVFVAGKERYSTKHATFLFHGVNMDIKQPVSFGLSQLREMSNRIEKSHEKIAGIICENTEMSKKEIEELFLQGKTEDSKFALRRGLISHEKSAKIPDSAFFISINFTGQ